MAIYRAPTILAKASLKKAIFFMCVPILFVIIWVISEINGHKIDRSIFYNIFGSYLPFVFYLLMASAEIYYINVFLNRSRYLEIRDRYIYISNIRRCSVEDIKIIDLKRKFNSAKYLRIFADKRVYVITSLLALDNLDEVQDRFLGHLREFGVTLTGATTPD